MSLPLNLILISFLLKTLKSNI